MDPTGLQGRERDILVEVIRYYVNRHQAVSARILSKQPSLTLSPTTIRNLMEDLHQAGFLSGQVAGRGRVPTRKALYVYLSDLIPPPPQPQAQAAGAALLGWQTPPADLPAALERAGRFLAEQTGLVVLAQLPGREAYPLDWLRVAHLDAHRILVALQTQYGNLWSRQVESAEPLEPGLFDAVERWVCATLRGAPLGEVREQVMSGAPLPMLEEASSLGQAFRLLRHALDWGREPQLMVWGEEHLFGMEGLEEPQALRQLYLALQDPATPQRLLAQAVAVEGGWVAVSPQEPPAAEPLAVVALPFGDGPWQGRLLLLGPPYMDYRRLFQLTGQVAAALSGAMEAMRLSRAAVPKE